MKKLTALIGLFLMFGSFAASAFAYDMNSSVQFYRANNWKGLHDYASQWAAAEPNNGRPFFCLGEAAFHTGNWQDAVNGFGRATQLMPNEPKPWNNLSAAYCKLQQWDNAARALADGEAASAKMCTATDWYVFGNGRKSLNDWNAAVADYKKALAMRPDFPEANNNLGVCMNNMGNNGAAKGYYNKAAAQGNKLSRENISNLQAEQQAAQQAAANGGALGNILRNQTGGSSSRYAQIEAGLDQNAGRQSHGAAAGYRTDGNAGQ